MNKRDNLKIISFDIDGVINNYPICFVDYVNHFFSKEFKNITEIKVTGNYPYYKDLYRKSEYKFNIDVDITVKNLILELYPNFKIKIFTRRPFHKYEHMFHATLNWLKKNQINHDGLFYKNIENFNMENVLIHIDDEEEHVHIIKNKFTKFIIINNGINIDNFFYLDNKKELRDKFFEVLEKTK